MKIAFNALDLHYLNISRRFKNIFIKCKDAKKWKIVLFGPTAISAANISKTTIYSGIGNKPETKLRG